MLVTDAELEGFAAQALNLARRDRERDEFTSLIAAVHGNSFHRMRTVEAAVAKAFGANWLNSGVAKDAAFAMLRRIVDIASPDVVVFVTAANMFRPTAKFDALPEAEKQKFVDEGHDGHHRGAREGYFDIVDSLLATAQTKERVCIRSQAYDDHHKADGPPQTQLFDQEGFGGRLKMFGARYDYGVQFARKKVC